jgi:regulator of sirC expression with transglutaminase-like and TPR domain
VLGVSFPGHFLMRVPSDAGHEGGDPIILDPFDRGRTLSRPALARLLADRAGPAVPWTNALIAPCSSKQIAIRMLNNIKRLSVAERAFEQAWQATAALVALDPDDPEHLRDRGLLAYHVDRCADALSDLEAYVRATDTAHEGSEQRSQIWEHIASLRRRVAGLN